MYVIPTVEKAKRLAHERHEGQAYGLHAYTVHLQHVHDILVDYGYGKNTQLLMAAWLHDIVEDTPTDLAEIAGEFGVGVAALVKAVTDEPGPNRRARKEATYQRMAVEFRNRLKPYGGDAGLWEQLEIAHTMVAAYLDYEDRAV